MAQLHCYLPEREAESLKRRASQAGMSVSRYLAELARKDLVAEWPPGYFDRVFCAADGAPIERAPQGEVETRSPLE
ncbi:MAG: hypothetical protein ACLFSC_11875 [Wenzhouxiangella sp.]